MPHGVSGNFCPRAKSHLFRATAGPLLISGAIRFDFEKFFYYNTGKCIFLFVAIHYFSQLWTHYNGSFRFKNYDFVFVFFSFSLLLSNAFKAMSFRGRKVEAVQHKKLLLEGKNFSPSFRLCESRSRQGTAAVTK